MGFSQNDGLGTSADMEGLCADSGGPSWGLQRLYFEKYPH